MIQGRQKIPQRRAKQWRLSDRPRARDLVSSVLYYISSLSLLAFTPLFCPTRACFVIARRNTFAYSSHPHQSRPCLGTTLHSKWEERRQVVQVMSSSRERNLGRRDHESRPGILRNSRVGCSPGRSHGLARRDPARATCRGCWFVSAPP